LEERTITKQEWDQFFDLIRKVVDLKDCHGVGLPWLTKAALVQKEAVARGDEVYLDEFVNWW
jgi:hypothetical protein